MYAIKFKTECPQKNSQYLINFLSFLSIFAIHQELGDFVN